MRLEKNRCVFEPFWQGPTIAGTLHSGLGIGLALVKQLVELHGGEVTAHSAGEGQGSTFTVTLPSIPSPVPVQAGQGTQTTLPCKVLLVEDNVDTLEATAALLRFSGHEVLEALDGDQALAMAAQHLPDVIVMDIGLPGRDGHAIAAALKADARLQHIPLIAMTGYGHQRPGARASHFNAFLIKPVDPDLLEQTIASEQPRIRAAPPWQS